ncbi:hypothetical protein E2320_014984, partial [Naja naja]
MTGRKPGSPRINYESGHQTCKIALITVFDLTSVAKMDFLDGVTQHKSLTLIVFLEYVIFAQLGAVPDSEVSRKQNVVDEGAMEAVYVLTAQMSFIAPCLIQGPLGAK